MTEAEWLASSDPAAMLRHLTHRRLGMTAEGEEFVTPRTVPLISPRRLRLFACACDRDACGGRPSWWAETVEAAIDDADVPVPPEMRRSYADPAGWALKYINSYECAGNVRRAALLRCIVGNPWRPASLPWRCRECGIPVGPPAAGYYCVKCGSDEAGRVPWLTPTALALAREAYTLRGEDGLLDPHRLGVLADALEDARMSATVECERCRGRGWWWRCPNCHGEWGGDVGPDCFVCSHPKLERRDCSDCHGTGRLPHPLLAHLRSPGSHVRGCWAVDLLLGRE